MIYQGKNYTDSSALDYYQQGRNHILIHKETDALIYHLLEYLSFHGLDETIQYILIHKKNGFPIQGYQKDA